MKEIFQRIHPEGPYGLQKRGKGAEKQNRSAGRAKKNESPQLASGRAQQKQKHRSGNADAVQGVQQACQPGKPQTKRPQQIIESADGQSQQNGLAEHQQLLGYRVGHTPPKSRLKNPPRDGP